ncbi:DNA invertase Pin-like site-specific DNA recombinase [Methanolobus bombayensis]|nr:DNA invertase Pin-like site-specific DNA recombinase [Methanolobus bombayensis]
MGIDTSHIFFDEGISGDVPADDRQGFQDMLKHLRKNDITWVYTFEISWIGRTYYDTLETLIELEKSGIRIVSLSPNESWTKIEDPVMRGVFISFYAWAAENEKRSVQERVKSGIRRVRAEGKTWGRPTKEPNRSLFTRYKNKGHNIAEISRLMDIPDSTLSKYVREWKRQDEQERIAAV